MTHDPSDFAGRDQGVAAPRPDAASAQGSTADESRPLEARLPPTMHASAAEIPPLGEDEPPWWRPDWRDAARHVGYRWIYLLPAVLCLVLLMAAPFVRIAREALLVLGFKLVLFSGGVAVALAAFVVGRAVRARQEPFCIHCGYNLSGLPDQHRCPECGRPYSWRVIAEYRRDPEWFIARWRAARKLPDADAQLDVPADAPRRRTRDGT